jgi:hypothetical protein
MNKISYDTGIHWIARILSLLIISLFIFFLIAHLLSDLPNDSLQWELLNEKEKIQFIFIGLGLFGLVIGWMKPLWGGTLAMICIFCISWINPMTLTSPFLIIGIVALLYIITGLLALRKK